MHQSDLNWYVTRHPNSTLAKLTRGGSEYTNASTSNPSDSDPGGTALMTGGNPKTTGVFYDVEYSHNVDEPGAACTPGQPATGGDVIYDSPDDALASVPDLHQPLQRHLPVLRRERLDLPRRRRQEPGRDHESEVQPEDVAQPGDLPGRPEELPADHPVGLPRRQHHLPGDPQRRAAHRVVGQARGVCVVQRSRLGRAKHRRPVLSGDRLPGGRAERRALPAGRRLGPHRRRHQAVRRLQGPGRAERNRRPRPLGQDEGRDSGDLRE